MVHFTNKLPLAKRVQILSMLCDRSFMRSISRVVDVSINTVTKLLKDAGETCAAIHDETVRDVKVSRVQCDEIWSFRHAKEKMSPPPLPLRKVLAMCGRGRPSTPIAR